MFEDLELFPDAASTVAGRIDALYFFLLAMAGTAVTGIFSALILFAVRYRRRRGHRARQLEGSMPLEVFWSAVPVILWVAIFVWGAKLYSEVTTPPSEGMEFSVTAKQWMWKIQHPSGQREINSLHVPLGEPVILTMISEDVIHSFYVPAFRIKQDVLPGRRTELGLQGYTRIWFQATKVGSYHLFCAEYCGTKHSQMIGEVVVMDPSDYQDWLSGQPAGGDPIEAGRVLFENLRCATCHAADSAQRGPDLAGRFGKDVRLEGGETVLFDENYVRESILDPKRALSAGFTPQMPTYAGQVTEAQIQQLVAYLKSLSPEGKTEAP